MSKTARQKISIELPTPLLEKLGHEPAKKILALVEKYVDEGDVPSRRSTK